MAAVLDRFTIDTLPEALGQWETVAMPARTWHRVRPARMHRDLPDSLSYLEHSYTCATLMQRRLRPNRYGASRRTSQLSPRYGQLLLVA
jgi:hypothetical protein